MPPTPSSPQAQRESVPPAVVIAGAGPVTLKQLLGSLGPATRLTVSASLYVAEQLARIVGAMHERGRVHGLLSTSQVQVAADGSVQVCGPEGAPRPPTAYLAPEVRNGEPPDVLADVHAIGAITFELLTGMTVLQAFVRAPMRELTRTPAPSLFNPGVDLSIDELVTAAVDRDPGVRPHSVRALHDGIRHCFGELDLEPSPRELAAVVSERFPAASMVPLQMPVPAPPHAAASMVPLQMPVPAPQPAASMVPLQMPVPAPQHAAAPMVPLQMPVPTAPAVAGRITVAVPAPRAPAAEGFEAVTPTSRFDVRRHLARMDEEEAWEEETTGSTELPVPAMWSSGRKWVLAGLGAAVAVAAVVAVIVSWPSPPVVEADELPVTRSAGKVNPVFVPAPLVEPAPALEAPPVKAAPEKKAKRAAAAAAPRKAAPVKKATKSRRRTR